MGQRHNDGQLRALKISLRNWNWGVAAVHFSSFVALLILTLTGVLNAPDG